ncbi:MAG: glycosyl transferase [Pseudorhodobacter sp.]|nr:glycosyl transferase [Pseudorhodobacter sp.]
MPPINCICIKYGTLYGAEYVNNLLAGLKRQSRADIRMFCMTEDRAGIVPEVEILPLASEPFHARMFKAMETAPKRGRLQKISVFRPDLIPDLEGPLMVFDLDVAITGSIDEMRDHAPGKVCMRLEWNVSKRVPTLGHGSVERFDPKQHTYLYEFIATNPEEAVALGGGSEQSYTSLCAQKHGDFAPFPSEWVASFKYDCRPRRPFNLLVEPHQPPQAKVVCFHGRPSIPEAISGYRAGVWRSTKPCNWLAKAWSV